MQICKNLFDTPLSCRENSLNTEITNLLKKTNTPMHSMRKEVAGEQAPKIRNNQSEFTLKQKLPFHLKSLFELFIVLDQVVRDVYRKGELCFLSGIAQKVSMKR